MTINQALEILNPENNRPALPQQRMAFEVVKNYLNQTRACVWSYKMQHIKILCGENPHDWSQVIDAPDDLKSQPKEL